MPLSIAEVEHIAELARLRLSPDEIARYRQQLSAILDYFAQLQELDTDDIPPTSSVLPPPGGRSPSSGLRPDQPRPGLQPADLLHNAPDVADDQFRVPPVLD